MSTSSPAGRLWVGTRKGIFTLDPDLSRTSWTLGDVQFLGHVAHHVVADPRDPNHVLAAMRTGHLGPTVFRSADGGETWTEASRPPAFPTGERLGRSVKRVFWLTPGHPDHPSRWYAGASPQALFVSDDDGDTWDPVNGWNDHPRWEEWAEWPEEQTPDGSMLHSVLVDPGDAAHLYIGLSGGGVFESTDGGADWHPLNAGVAIDFYPGEDREFGHDPHCVRIHPRRPERLYQQNHCGIYRLDRPAERWERIGDNMPRSIGDIGFPVELHHADPDMAWVFPMDGTDVWPRTSPGGIPAVYRTTDAGQTWAEQRNGLPDRGWMTVLRQAMTTDAHDTVGVYFGTTGGEVWASPDEGSTWHCAAAHLPEIYSLEWSPALAS